MLSTLLQNIGTMGAQPQLTQSGAFAAAQQAANYANLAQAAQSANQRLRKRYMIDGEMMDFKEFVQTIFPEDTPEKTFFLLRYSEENK